MSKFRRFAAIALLITFAQFPASAVQNRDSGALGLAQRIAKIVRQFTNIFAAVSQDEPQPPHP